MPTELVLHALEQALTLRQSVSSLIIHADRSSQYSSLACQARIRKAQTLASYSQPNKPYGNAQAEIGWSMLKTKLLPHGGAFASIEEAQRGHTYFKLDHRHSLLCYRSPHQFEHDFQICLSYFTVRFYWTIPDLEDAFCRIIFACY